MNIWLESGRRAATDLFSGLASHVWISTIFLLAVLVILSVLRRRLTAGARFSLVLIGLARFALPHAAVGVFLEALGDAFRIGSPGALERPLQAVAGALRVDLAPAETRLGPAIALGLWGAVALLMILAWPGLTTAWPRDRRAPLSPLGRARSRLSCGHGSGPTPAAASRSPVRPCRRRRPFCASAGR